MTNIFEEKRDGTLVGAWRAPVNIAADAEGSIHNDETAQQLGLEGGWIAGSIHMEQFAPLLLERFGAAWLRHGTMSVYFRNATLSGQRVQAHLGPTLPETGWATLKMENERGRTVCEGVAYTEEVGLLTPVQQRLATARDQRPGALLSHVKVGDRALNVPSLISAQRLAKDLPGITEPIAAYENGALPANLSIDALRAVEPHLAELPPGAVGLYGAIQLQMRSGPIKAGTDYQCNGEVVSVGQTPRTETLWYNSELFQDGFPVANMLMMSRIMAI